MSYLDALGQFCAHQFSWWYDNPFQFDPDNKTLYYYCPIPGRRDRILQDIPIISNLNIGIEHFIIVCPFGSIECISMNLGHL